MLDMMCRLSKLVVLLVLMISVIGCKTAYVSGSGPNPNEHIEKLKDDGTLIVFMHSYRDELTALQKIIDSEITSKSKRIVATSRYNELLVKRDQVINQTIFSFQEYYKFSKVAFSFDHQLAEIADGNVVIEEILPDRSTRKMKLPESVYFLKYTMLSNLDTSHEYIWDFLTREGKVIPSPFPNVRRKFSFWHIPQVIFSKSYNNRRTHLGDMINYKLYKFYGENTNKK